MVILCQLKDLGLSCFGCCGNSYSNKKKLVRDIRKNNFEFKNKRHIKQFMVRKKELRPSGICANLVFVDGKYFCPGHRLLNKGHDYRNLDPDCNKDFLCKTFFLFKEWNKEKQDKFLEFLKTKNFDSFTYSIKMGDDSILKEFEKKK